MVQSFLRACAHDTTAAQQHLRDAGRRDRGLHAGVRQRLQVQRVGQPDLQGRADAAATGPPDGAPSHRGWRRGAGRARSCSGHSGSVLCVVHICFISVLRIRIRIRGSMPLTNGSGCESGTAAGPSDGAPSHRGWRRGAGCARSCSGHSWSVLCGTYALFFAVLRSRIRFRRIRMFLGLLDPDPMVRDTDPV